jgi:hypothetical protein
MECGSVFLGAPGELDHESVKGRLLSSSYTPETGHANHGAMIAELSEIYQAHGINGRVTIDHIPRMYYGRLR